MVLGVKAGVDPKRLFEILSTSGGRSHHFLKRFPNVLAGDFTPNFAIGLSRKDMALALNVAGRDAGAARLRGAPGLRRRARAGLRRPRHGGGDTALRAVDRAVRSDAAKPPAS